MVRAMAMQLPATSPNAVALGGVVAGIGCGRGPSNA
jgi:hypothetical protein